MKKLWSFEDDYPKLNGNVAAAPNFTTVRHVFEALPGAQIMHMICSFEAWKVRNPMLQTVRDLDLKRRSYGYLKTDCAKVRKFRTLKSKVRKILSKVRKFF